MQTQNTYIYTFKMDGMHVCSNAVVSLRYRMKNSSGDVLEDILQSKSVEYLHGSGAILPALEADLIGLQPGDKKQVAISNATSFQLDTSFYFDVIIDNVRVATDDEIRQGRPVKEEVTEECGPDCIC